MSDLSIAKIELCDNSRNATILFYEKKIVSVSLLQKTLQLSYNKSGLIIDTLENIGIISGFMGSAPRKLLISDLKQALKLIDEYQFLTYQDY